MVRDGGPHGRRPALRHLRHRRADAPSADFETLFSSGNRFAFLLVEDMARQLVKNLRAADLLLARPEATLPPLSVSTGLFSEGELAALDFGEVPAAPPRARPA